MAVRLSTTLETTSEVGSSVVLECFREGSKLRVHTISPGFQANFRVQFPRNIRQEGMRYVVDEVRLSARGNFYRACGNTKRQSTLQRYKVKKVLPLSGPDLYT